MAQILTSMFSWNQFRLLTLYIEMGIYVLSLLEEIISDNISGQK